MKLDPRLENDSIEIGHLQKCQVRLMDDKRWPWLVLIPQIDDGVELHDLDQEGQMLIAQDTATAAKALKQLTGCHKINTGALGNIVRQLHVHVVARDEGDANWPGPVWGFGERVAYGNGETTKFLHELKKALDVAAN